jgi:hypothetical protein
MVDVCFKLGDTGFHAAILKQPIRNGGPALGISPSFLPHSLLHIVHSFPCWIALEPVAVCQVLVVVHDN